MVDLVNRKNSRVTVIIPCYNMENKIHRLLDSLLAQSSHDFKVIIVDDGSADNTKKVVESYLLTFSKMKIDLNYYYQENGGVSAAVNNGLKKVDTEYFCLPDADDFLSSTYIEDCVDYLLCHKECGIVFTQCNVYHQDSLNKRVGLLQRYDKFENTQEKIISDFIWGRQVYYCPNYMIRKEDFLKANGRLQIEAGKYGQNYQMILPMTVYKKCGYIARPLYNYIIYNQSISHGQKTIDQRYKSIDGGTISLHETIKNLNIDEKKKADYHHFVDQKNAIQKADVALEYGDRWLFEKYYKDIDIDSIPKEMENIFVKREIPFYFVARSIIKRTRKRIITSPLSYKIKSLFWYVKDIMVLKK